MMYARSKECQKHGCQYAMSEMILSGGATFTHTVNGKVDKCYIDQEDLDDRNIDVWGEIQTWIRRLHAPTLAVIGDRAANLAVLLRKRTRVPA